MSEFDQAPENYSQARQEQQDRSALVQERCDRERETTWSPEEKLPVFVRACRIVDEAISAEGVEVSAVDRNQRVSAMEHQLRTGVDPRKVNTGMRLIKIQLDVPHILQEDGVAVMVRPTRDTSAEDAAECEHVRKCRDTA